MSEEGFEFLVSFERLRVCIPDDEDFPAERLSIFDF